LFNHEYVRVFNKNNYGAGVRIYNLYMVFSPVSRNLPERLF
jgi:hypothetical protein